MKVFAEVQFGGWVEVQETAPLRASGGIYGGGYREYRDRQTVCRA